MDRRGLVGLIIIAAIVFVIITGTSVYFKFKEGGLEISAGDTTVDVNLNITKNNNNTNISVNPAELNETNQTEEYDSIISIGDDLNQSTNPTSE